MHFWCIFQFRVLVPRLYNCNSYLLRIYFPSSLSWVVQSWGWQQTGWNFIAENMRKDEGKNTWPLAYLTSYECAVGSGNFSLKHRYTVPSFLPSPRQRQYEQYVLILMSPSRGKGWCHLPCYLGEHFQHMELNCPGWSGLWEAWKNWG